MQAFTVTFPDLLVLTSPRCPSSGSNPRFPPPARSIAPRQDSPLPLASSFALVSFRKCLPATRSRPGAPTGSPPSSCRFFFQADLLFSPPLTPSFRDHWCFPAYGPNSSKLAGRCRESLLHRLPPCFQLAEVCLSSLSDALYLVQGPMPLEFLFRILGPRYGRSISFDDVNGSLFPFPYTSFFEL